MSGSVQRPEEAGPAKQSPCEAGRHKYDPHTLACRCGVKLEEPGQGFMFGYDPLTEGETRRREAASGQREMFHGETRQKAQGETK